MTRVRWTAARDGVAHAHVGRVTACGAPFVADRFAWPTASRCPTCTADLAAAAERRADALTRAARVADFADQIEARSRP
jgi:hypothetical protein